MLHSPLAVLRPIGPRVSHRIEPRRAVAATAIVVGWLVGALLPTTAGAEPARLHGPAPDPASAAAAVEPRIELAVGVVPSMAVGGLGCEEAVAAGLTPAAGQGTSTFCFAVTNAGTVAVGEITITDARAGLLGAVLPQVGGNSVLDPGEQALFYHHAVPVPAPADHRPEASARAVGVPPNDIDWSVGGVVSADAEPPDALAMTGPTLAQPWLLAALATGLIFFGYTAIVAVRRPIGESVGDPTDSSDPTDPVGGRSLLDVYGGDEVDARVVLEAEEAAVRAQEEVEPEPIGRRRADDGPEPAVVFGGDPAPTPIEPEVPCQPGSDSTMVTENAAPPPDAGGRSEPASIEQVDGRDPAATDAGEDVEPEELAEMAAPNPPQLPAAHPGPWQQVEVDERCEGQDPEAPVESVESVESVEFVESTGDRGSETPDEPAELVEDRDLAAPIEAVESAGNREPAPEPEVERPTSAVSPVVVVLSVSTTAACPLPTPVGGRVHRPFTSRRWAVAGPDTRILTGRSLTEAVTSPFTGSSETMVAIRPRPTETIVELRPIPPTDTAPAATSSGESAVSAEADSAAEPDNRDTGGLDGTNPDDASDEETEETEVDGPVPGLRPEVAIRWRADQAPEPDLDPEPLPRLTAVPSLDDGWSSPVPELPRWCRTPTSVPARRSGRPLPAALVPLSEGSDAPIPVPMDAGRRSDHDDVGDRRPELTLVPAVDDTADRADRAGHAQLDAFGFD